MYRVTIDPNAKEQFSGHVKFLKHESHTVARRLVLSYKKSPHRIAENPFQFHFADGLDVKNMPPDTYSRFICGA
jgi:hypothetical protein